MSLEHSQQLTVTTSRHEVCVSDADIGVSQKVKREQWRSSLLRTDSFLFTTAATSML
jgi:hypothetical protein